MFDIRLRATKDAMFEPCCDFVPSFVTPLDITAAAFLTGLLSCICASQDHVVLSLTFWLLNRALDCLDGAVARRRSMASDLGGFLDLLGDFIIYSLIPIAIATITENHTTWSAVAILEAAFHINNFVLFYIAAIVEKRESKGDRKVKELTSLAMKPALIEGLESGILFTLMLGFPQLLGLWSWIMAALVAVGTVQRVSWIVPALKSSQQST